jgi:hypothetical protein
MYKRLYPGKLKKLFRRGQDTEKRDNSPYSYNLSKNGDKHKDKKHDKLISAFFS